MANTYKDIVITTNRSINSANDVPEIRFAGGDANTNTNIYLRVYTTSNGTLSFEGSAGQLFSITNDLGNTLFSVNDISGIPSMEINADGRIILAEYGGNVGIGTANAWHKLDVNAGVNVNSYVIISGLNVAPALIAAFGYANGVNTNAFSSIATAIAAYGAANLAYTFAANNAFLVGNTAYGAANTTYTYAANSVMLAANTAYGKANAANIIADAAFTRANLAYTFAANNAFLVGNTAYAKANAANIIADAAFTRANLAYTFAANTAMLAANASYAAQNTNWTYTANVVMSAANAAFSVANGANIIPVGNTMSNGYWTIRSTRRRINFIPGTNITVNVDDDATLNTANVTITSTASGGGYFQGNAGNTGSVLGLSDIFRVHTNTMSENVTICSGNNAIACGPLTINTDRFLTIQTGARVSIV